MANPEHLKLLLEGVGGWNQWRKDNPEVIPDLSKADLSRATLEGVNLEGANLIEADLSNADLNDAYIRWAKLEKANLSYAHLSAADLCGANFTRANLKGANLNLANLFTASLNKADLNKADLRAANLTSTNLDEADLSNAAIGATVFGTTDLSSVTGLDTVMHHAPSPIGIDTLYESRGKIPEVFLRGCGVPENFIPFIKSLVNKPIEFYSCFISYSHADKSFARRLHDQLRILMIVNANSDEA